MLWIFPFHIFNSIIVRSKWIQMNQMDIALRLSAYTHVQEHVCVKVTQKGPRGRRATERLKHCCFAGKWDFYFYRDAVCL